MSRTTGDARGDFRRARRSGARGAAVRGRAANDARGDVLVKVIIEAPLLNDKVKRLACKIVVDSRRLRQDLHRRRHRRHDPRRGADARRAPEGWGHRAGEITTLEAVQAMIGAGAARVSTPSAEASGRAGPLNGNADGAGR
jgi:hypothetical protein